MRIGFLINPIAGMGGRVGLKGTDGVAGEAARRGAQPVAPGRAALALERLQAGCRGLPPVDWLTCAGPMGEAALRAAGFERIAIVHRPGPEPGPADTATAVKAFLEAQADLILFCGGDGTARDIAALAGTAVPVLGIPSGVKMFSGVFGTTPVHAAELALGFIAGRLQASEVEILDLDEESYRQGKWAVRLYMAARTPYEPGLTQAAKTLVTGETEEVAKADIAAGLKELVAERPGRLVLLGPGSTVQAAGQALGVPDKTLLGIDALLDGVVVGRDLDEAGLLALLGGHPEALLVLSPIGAQGFVLGRGNLQISPAVIRRIGLDRIVVIATPAKLRATPALRFDTGDAALDAELAARRYLPVVTGYRRSRATPVAA